MAKEIAEEYASSLADLTMNSKPLINMLTILAEENVEHAGVIVETVEKHLEKVPPEIKLPVLYLVDSIIKNVGAAYTQKFSQTIVNMFTRTFKQVDEKTRSQMFKLRDTWHEVFPATKLYQLDVKVNLIDPAWPIQAQPQQSNIHVNPNFLKKPLATPSAPPKPSEDHMKSILAKKEQELLMLQRKKIEMELEQAKKQLEIAENSTKKPIVNTVPPMPSALVNPVVTPALPVSEVAPIASKLRLGPPINNINKSPTARIAPVSGALVAASRRDPRLARQQNNNTTPIAPNVFDIKPLERVTKRKNVITIDVTPELVEQPKEQRARKDPRLEKKADRRRDIARTKIDRKKRDDDKPKLDEAPKEQIVKTAEPKSDVDDYLHKLQVVDPKRINKLPPIPKINKDKDDKTNDSSPTKRRKELRNDKEKKKESSSPLKNDEKKGKNRKKKSPKQKDTDPIAFKELKNFNKDKYMRRNREQSESPEKNTENLEGPIVGATSKIIPIFRQHG